MRSHSPDELLVVVTGRPYNLYDERLNLRLGQSLAKIGVAALPWTSSMCPGWTLRIFHRCTGARRADPANRQVDQRHAHCFGLHLTNFGCGADSFIEHFYKHIMGSKASLILELDEHSASAGVMTRLEAYQHVIGNSLRKNQWRKPALRLPGRREPQLAGAAPKETVMAVCS